MKKIISLIFLAVALVANGQTTNAPGIKPPTGFTPTTNAPGTATSFSITNMLFVAKNGNNSTAARGRLERPYLTLTAAKNAATNGNTIMVFPGTYNETDLMKHGVNWHFVEGADIVYRGTDTTWALFDDKGLAVTSNVSGSGNFIYAPNVDYSLTYCGVLAVSNNNSVVSFTAKDIMYSNNTPTFSLSYSGVRVPKCKYVNLKANRIKAIGDDNAGVGLWWTTGEMDASVDRIETTSGYAVFGDEDGAFSPTISTSLYLTSKYIYSSNAFGIWYYADTLRSRLWVTAEEIKSSKESAINMLSSGRLYVTSQKVSNDGSGNLTPAIRMENNVGYSWMNIQKVSSNFGYIDNDSGATSGTNYLNIMHFEPLAGITNGIRIRSGDWYISGQDLAVPGGTAIDFTGGRAMIEGYTTKGLVPIFLSANGLRVKNVALVASGTESIKAGSAKTIGVYGTSVASKAKNSNVTIGVGTLTVDSTVE